MEIELVSFNEKWKEEFITERNYLITQFGADLKAVEHVGSTAIPVDLSKPVIDIFVGVAPFKDHEYYAARLNTGCYQYTITGMKHRHLFMKYDGEKWSHNIHILEHTPQFYYLNEILFRDFLNDKKELMLEYSLLKKTLTDTATDLDEYTKGKTAFIQKVVDRARTEKGLPLVSVWE